MKDFYDLWVIARKFDFNGETLSEAIGNTFSRRQTPLPVRSPSGLSAEFHEDTQKNNQWNAFLRKGALAANSPSLAEVCGLLERFLLPPTQAVLQKHEFMAKWEAGGSWH